MGPEGFAKYVQPAIARLSLSTVNGMANSSVRIPLSPSGVYSTVTRIVPDTSALPSRSSRLWRNTFPSVSMIRAMSGQ